MNRIALFFVLFLLATPVVAAQQPKSPVAKKPATAAKTATQEIQELEQRFAGAFRAKDVDKIMSDYFHGPEVVAFDAIPPRQYAGWDAYKKDWEGFFASTSGPIDFHISDLVMHTERPGTMAYSHSFQEAKWTDKNGKKFDAVFRVTDVYRKIDGRWLIVHEHVSFPVDLDTGKADLLSKP